jgi:hypothetical protein
MRVMSSFASSSSCFTRLWATLSSGAVSFWSTTGKGLEARRFWSASFDRLDTHLEKLKKDRDHG